MILDDDELKKRLPYVVVKDYNEESVKSSHYELHLGDEYFTTNTEHGVREKIKNDKQITIRPGQLALLITKEEVHIPTDLMAFISIKAGIKFRGLVNVSGFHVDPGFKGKLKFAVFNAGSANIALDWEQPLFPMWLCRLTGTTAPYNGVHNHQNRITSNDVAIMQGEIIAPNELNQKFKKLEKQVSTMKAVRAGAFTLMLALTVAFIGRWMDASWNDQNYRRLEKQSSLEQDMNNLRQRVDSQMNSDIILNQRVKQLEDKRPISASNTR